MEGHSPKKGATSKKGGVTLRPCVEVDKLRARTRGKKDGGGGGGVILNFDFFCMDFRGPKPRSRVRLVHVFGAAHETPDGVRGS
jgi:hypothetical protein